MKYGFIGCGNMGGAIAKALSQSTKDILLADATDKAAILAKELGCSYADNQTVVSSCDRIFLAVKPQIMAEVLKPFQPLFKEKKPLIITMAAGLTLARIEEMIGTSLPIIRIMPNTPVSVNSGMILYCCNSLVDNAVLQDFLQDTTPCGQWDNLQEDLIDAAGVVSGCGPAYMYMFLDALAKGAENCGVPRQKALSYAAATMIGAAKMVQQDGRTPEELKNAVCSPGGSTISGIRALENHGFRAAAMEAVIATYNRTFCRNHYGLRTESL